MLSRLTSELGVFSSPKDYRGQNYEALRKESQGSGTLYTDPLFPAEDKALSATPGKFKNIEWKRPKDICEDPKLFVDGASSNDLIQGQLGNCWFVAACSCLAIHKEIWQKVIPDHHEQEWSSENPDRYAGIFHFNLWSHGEWLDVVIDDRLPTSNGSLVFVHSTSRNEFWSALVEKAYAKLFGSYEALDGGELAEALEDFTGGVAEPIDFATIKVADDEEARKELFDMLKKEAGYKSLMAASIPAASSEEMEARTDTGLVKGHAYGITAVKRVPLEGTGILNMFNRDKISMIRLRNPWGGKEWNGRFSDGSPEWENIASDSRSKIGLTFEDDGEFWMLFEDFCTFFKNAAVCRVINTSVLSLRKTWTEALLPGAWAAGRDGGCINNKDTFLQNPQYAFSVGDNQDDVLLSLMQKGGRGENEEKMTIGFTILKVEENRRYRLHHLPQVAKSSMFRNSRSVILRHGLGKGHYCVVPTTFEAKLTRPFLLRIYTSSASSAMELKDDEPQPNALSSILGCLPCFKMPVLLTQVIVLKAVGLEGKKETSSPDPFCTISCEGEKVKTPVCKDTLNPEWNTGAIFYRAQPTTKQIKISVWNSNMMRDELMGVVRIDARTETTNEILELGLTEKNDPGSKRPGTVFVRLLVSSNLQAL